MILKNNNAFMYNLVRAGDTIEIADENIAKIYLQNGFIRMDEDNAQTSKQARKITVKKIVNENKDI